MLLHGRLLPGARPQELFRQLVEEAQVHPFLLAVGTAEVIVGAFATATTSSPSGPEREGRARPLETMLRSLRGIDPFWADLRGLDVLVDHAYDRLGHRPD